MTEHSVDGGRERNWYGDGDGMDVMRAGMGLKSRRRVDLQTGLTAVGNAVRGLQCKQFLLFSLLSLKSTDI